jgi:uncharacterized spore protein YtfJ
MTGRGLKAIVGGAESRADLDDGGGSEAGFSHNPTHKVNINSHDVRIVFVHMMTILCLYNYNTIQSSTHQEDVS